MKKILIATTLLIASGAIFFRPMPIIGSQHRVEVFRVFYNWEDVSDRIDSDEIIKILRNYNTRRSFNNPFPNFVADTIWDIGLARESGHVNISLGKDSVLYVFASDRIMHSIKNACYLWLEAQRQANDSNCYHHGWRKLPRF